MAMNKLMKRSIAMLLIMNMMTGMIPAQALAAKGDSGKVKVTVSSKSKSKSSSSKSKSKSSSSKSSSSKSSSSSSSKSSAPKKSMSKKLEAKLAAEKAEAERLEAEKLAIEKLVAEMLDSLKRTEQGDTVEVETSAGNKELVDVDVTTNQVTNKDGSTSDLTDVTAEGFVTESGAIVDFNGSSELTQGTDGELSGGSETFYKVLKELGVNGYYEAEGGSKMVILGSEFDESLIGKLVSVPLKPDEYNRVEGDPAGTVLDQDGDAPSSVKDGTYNYENLFVVKSGDVTVITTGVEFDHEMLEQIRDENGELIGEKDLSYTVSTVKPENGENENGLITWVYNAMVTPPLKEETLETEGGKAAVVEALKANLKAELGLSDADFEKKWNEELYPELEGKLDIYDYVIVGNGNVSQFWPVYMYQNPYEGENPTNDPGVMVGDEKLYLHEGLLHKYSFSHDKYEKYGFPKGDYSTAEFRDFWIKMQNDPELKKEVSAFGTTGYSLYNLSKLAYNRYESNAFDHYYENGERKELDDEVMMFFGAAQQFALVDAKTGELITTYCADIGTPTEDRFFYNIENLEDADYYNAEQAAMIRTIAENGYWGTAAGEKGSLDAVKAMMKESGAFTDAEIEALNDGMALAATQMAIWTFSNKMSGIKFMNAQYAKDGDPDGNLSTPYASLAIFGRADGGSGEAAWNAQKDNIALLYKLYDHLINMKPTEIERPTTADTVITAENFVKDMNVTVIGKAEDHQNNKDDDRDNDAYKTNLSFALVVEPSGDEKDSLVVKVLGANGKEIAAGRIAGELKEGETQLRQDKNGNYTFENIVMIEGEQQFELTLEGIQNLTEGIYLYSSEVQTDANGEETSSQTMVGKAGGTRVVSVAMRISFDLDVNERVVAKERVWRDEFDPRDYDGGDDTPTPTNYRLTRGVGQLEIIDEEVPLAEPPQTGDISMLYFAMVLMSGLGLCMLNLLEKKREEA